MHLRGEDLNSDASNDEGSGPSSPGGITDQIPHRFVDRRRISESHEEWSTPLAKIKRLVFDHDSWLNASEILERPSPECRKVGDEARSLAARHVIDRLREKQYLDKIQKVAPRLRSAVELLSKPDADYVYPPFRFVVNQLRERHPEIYTSVTQTVGLQIPHDTKPTTILVSMAKYVIENSSGVTTMDWGKFTVLLGLTGALAIDSVEADYSEGVAEVVDTFGLLVEQVMGEWILAEDCGGGWEGFIKENHYEPILSPIPRTIVILTLGFLFLFVVGRLFYNIWNLLMIVRKEEDDTWRKWGNAFPHRYCGVLDGASFSLNSVCENPSNPLDFLYAVYFNNN